MKYSLETCSNAWKAEAKANADSIQPVLTRTGSEQEFSYVDLTFDLKDKIKAEGLVIIGAAEMGNRCSKLLLPDVDGTPLHCKQWAMLPALDGGYVLFGIASWNIFSCDMIIRNGSVTIRFFGDGKLFGENESIPLEEVFFCHAETERAALDRYADHVAAKQTHKLNLCNWRGWGSWDYYALKFTDEDLIRNIQNARALYPGADLLQIDDGYSLWGDWLDVCPEKFPNGIEAVVNRMKQEGIKTGLWMAPFLVEDNTKVLEEHPDWFIKNPDGSLYHHDGTRYYLLDFSQDGPLEYIRNCVREYVKMGIVYFKMDFLAAGVRAIASKNPMTPLERFHRCMNAIREEAGESTYILGCSAAFGPCIGHVDGMRVEPDVSPHGNSIRMSAGCFMASAPFHRKWYQCDTDYLVVRGKESSTDLDNKKGNLTFSQAKIWADFLTLTGSTLLDSDEIALLTEERKQLLRSVWDNAGKNETYYIPDFQSGGADDFSSMIWSNGKLGVFNWYDKENTFTLPNGETLTLPPWTSKVIPDYPWDGTTCAGLPCDLSPLETTVPDFTGAEIAIPVSLEQTAKMELIHNRKTGEGLLSGSFADLIGDGTFKGVYFHINEQVIGMTKKSAPVTVNINMSGKRLFVLHTALYPTSGEWLTYTVHFADGSKQEFVVDAGVDKLVSDYHYAAPWQSEHTRIAWTNPLNECGAYVMELPFGEKKEIRSLEIGTPDHPGTHVLFALSVCKS